MAREKKSQCAIKSYRKWRREDISAIFFSNKQRVRNAVVSWFISKQQSKRYNNNIINKK